MGGEVRAGRPGGAAGGDVLDPPGVVPRPALARVGVEHVDELAPGRRQQLLEPWVIDTGAVEAAANRDDDVVEAGRDHLNGRVGAQVVGGQSERGGDREPIRSGQWRPEARDALVHRRLVPVAAPPCRHAHRALVEPEVEERRFTGLALVVEHRGRPQHRVAGEVELLVLGEDLRGRVARIRSGEQEDRLELPHLARDREHLGAAQPVGLGKHRQPVPPVRLPAEHVDVDVSHPRHPTRSLRDCDQRPAKRRRPRRQHSGLAGQATVRSPAFPRVQLRRYRLAGHQPAIVDATTTPPSPTRAAGVPIFASAGATSRPIWRRSMSAVATPTRSLPDWAGMEMVTMSASAPPSSK